MISNGERVELLIVFPDNPKFDTLSICGSRVDTAKSNNEHSKLESNKPVSGPKSVYNLNKITLNKRVNPSFNPDSIKNLLFPSVAYVNLTDAAYENNVAVKRMRPLLQANGVLTIHGRADFHSGQS